jgi:hypothetical protein
VVNGLVMPVFLKATPKQHRHNAGEVINHINDSAELKELNTVEILDRLAGGLSSLASEFVTLHYNASNWRTVHRQVHLLARLKLLLRMPATVS